MSFKEVIEKYGYPVVSKNVSQYVREIKGTKSDKLKNLRLYGIGSTSGIGVLSKKWRVLIDAPFDCSEKCCSVMKKSPLHKFDKESQKHPIIGTMAHESKQRQTTWVQNGCNAFNKKNPSSQPMSFWTEQDVLQYIKQFNVPYASVYGDIVEVNGSLTTTGESRTGCMFCMFGCHLEKEPNRFQRMKITHPKLYDYCMRNTRVIDKESGEEIAFVSNSSVFGITKWTNHEIQEWINRQKEQDELFHEHYEVISGLGMGDVLDYIGVKH